MDHLLEQMRKATGEAWPNGDQVGPEWDGPSLAAPEGAWDRHTEPTAKAMAEALRDWITELVDSPHARIGGALRAANGMYAYLKSLSAEVARLGNELPGCQRLHPSQHVSVLTRVGDLLRSITAEVLSLCDQVREMQQEIEQVSQGFPQPLAADQQAAGKGQEHDEELSEALGRAIRRRLPELLRSLEERFQAEFFERHGGLSATLTAPAEHRRVWPGVLNETAREVVRGALNNLDAAQLLQELPGERAGLQSLLGRNFQTASKGWMPCARARRLLLVLPKGPSSEQLREIITDDLGRQPSTLTGSTGEVLLCYEAEGLSLRHLAERLSQGRGDLLAIARRVHTRSDVDWSPLGPEGGSASADLKT